MSPRKGIYYLIKKMEICVSLILLRMGIDSFFLLLKKKV